MLNHQWVSVLKQVAVATGWDASALGMLSYNSMRRFLPTMANVLRFPDSIAQAIGSWQEIPQGEGCAGIGVQLMSVHYSDQKALSSAEAKREVLDLFFCLVRRHAAAQAALDGKGSMLAPGTFSWEDLARLNHVCTHTLPRTAPPIPSPTPLPLLDLPAAGSCATSLALVEQEPRKQLKKDKKGKKEGKGAQQHKKDKKKDKEKRDTNLNAQELHRTSDTELVT